MKHPPEARTRCEPRVQVVRNLQVGFRVPIWRTSGTFLMNALSLLTLHESLLTIQYVSVRPGFTFGPDSFLDVSMDLLLLHYTPFPHPTGGERQWC